MIWTPYMIEIVLHHHCSPAPFPRYSAPAYWPTIDGLLALGVLENDGEVPRTTPLGDALVHCWTMQPLPTLKYVDPRSEVAA